MATTVDTLLVRIQADMTDLKKDLRRIGNQSEQVGNKMSNAFSKANTALLGLVGAAGLLKFGSGVVQTGFQVDQLRIKLEIMFGSAEQGALAFQTLDKFASKVPFSLRQISLGAGPLAVVAGKAENLNELLQITGNIASITGRPFEMIASQIQRAMSSGIASAEILRDDGIVAFMGFEKGAKISLEETIKALHENFGTGGKFDGAMDTMSKTAQGAVSMLGDAFFQMEKSIFQAGLDDAIVKISLALRNLIIAITPAISLLGNIANVVASILAPAIQFLADNIGALIAVVTLLTARFIALRLAALAVSVSMRAMPIIATTAAMINAKAASAALVVHLGGLSGALAVLKAGLLAVLKILGVLFIKLVIPLAILVGFVKLANAVMKVWQNSKDLGDLYKNLKEIFSAFITATKDQFVLLGNRIDVLRLKIKQMFIFMLFQITNSIAEAINKLIERINNSGIANKFGLRFNFVEGLGMHKTSEATKDLEEGIKDLNKAQENAKNSGAALVEILRKFGLIKAPPEHADPSVTQEQLEALEDKTKKLADSIPPMVEHILSSVQTMSRGLSDAFADMFMSGKMNLDSLKDVFRSFVKTMISKAIELFFVNRILSMIFPSAFTQVGSAFIAKGLATGGAVHGKQPYLVGERGPELFVPSTAGTMVNSNNTRSAINGSNGATVIQNINVTTGIQQTVRNEIRSLMPEIAANAKNAVADTKRRGGGFGRAFA
tara:strand:- start:4151 stop:6319 length:2169 start_codon:yes stop_codon:yes gene_type:complete